MKDTRAAILIVVIIYLAVALLILPKYRWCAESKVELRILDLLRHTLRKMMLVTNLGKLNDKVCTANLLALDDAMKAAGIPYWLSEGTALGVRRDGRFIPHDDDVDVATRICHLDAFVDNVLPTLEQQGFTVAKVLNKGRFFSLFRGEALDVDFVEEGHLCMFMTKTKGPFSWDKCQNLEAHLKSLRPIPFIGRQFLVPGVDYLRYMYGETWHIPQRGKVTIV